MRTENCLQKRECFIPSPVINLPSNLCLPITKLEGTLLWLTLQSWQVLSTPAQRRAHFPTSMWVHRADFHNSSIQHISHIELMYYHIELLVERHKENQDPFNFYSSFPFLFRLAAWITLGGIWGGSIETYLLLQSAVGRLVRTQDLLTQVGRISPLHQGPPSTEEKHTW